MFKSTVLLFVLGIALGLWLGFNPQAHGKVVQNWDHTRVFFAGLETNFSNTIHTWTMRTEVQAQDGQKTVSNISARPFTTAWQQFVSAGGTFLQSIQRIWLGLIASANTK
ncbi:MAG TPA: hypothetical protein VLZ89_03095 [Anaerolineales bacterium]|nr:hypothetical protein [Anaerolineales bacterium]